MELPGGTQADCASIFPSCQLLIGGWQKYFLPMSEASVGLRAQVVASRRGKPQNALK